MIFLSHSQNGSSYGVPVVLDLPDADQNSPPRVAGTQFMITNSPLTSALPLVRRAVTDIDSLKMESLKDVPNVRVIVDANHDLPFAASHEVSHELIIFKGKIHAIACRLPVRRIHLQVRSPSPSEISLSLAATALMGRVMRATSTPGRPSTAMAAPASVTATLCFSERIMIARSRSAPVSKGRTKAQFSGE